MAKPIEAKRIEEIKSLWKDISDDIKRDLAYIWADKDKVAKIEKDVEVVAEEVERSIRKLTGIKNIRDKNYYFVVKNRLIAHLKHIEAKPEWFRENRADLIEFLGFVDEFTQGERKSIRNERWQLLKRWGFPVNQHPRQAIFMVYHWRDVEKIRKASGKNARHLSDLFKQN